MRIFLNGIAVLLVIVLLAATVMFYGVQLMGLQAVPVTSDAMGSQLPKGAMVYVRKTDSRSLQPGQLITFLAGPEQPDSQRVVEVIPDGNDPSVIRYRTQGDAMAEPAQKLLLYRNVLGLPVFLIPFLGPAAGFFSSYIGGIALILGWIVAILLLILANTLLVRRPQNGPTPYRRRGKKGKFER